LSTSAIWVKTAVAPSAVIAFYRLLIAALVLFPAFLLRKQSRTEFRSLRKDQWLHIVFAGVLLALHYVMWFESLNFTSIASSTVLVSLQPLFSLTLERFVQKKRIPAKALIGCMIALAGCVIIGFGDFQLDGLSLFGDVIAFLAAGVIALYFFVGERVRKEVSAVTYSTLAYLISAITLLIYITLQSAPLSGFSTQTWISFLGLSLVSTIGGQFIFNLLLKNVPASAVTMSILGEPIGTCILAYLLLNESIALQQFVGIVVIMTGMIIYFTTPRKN